MKGGANTPRKDRRIVLALILGLLAGSLLSLLFVNTKPVSAIAPSGFTDQLIASVNRATALAFTPDGRLLVANQNGKLFVYQNGALRTTPALDISAKICSVVGERGLAGVAVDPNFAANHYIYIYYTFKKHGVCEQNTANVPVNRVERYELSDANVAAQSKILIDNIPHMYVHNGGDLHFGKDGYLYVTVGDGGCDYAGDSGCSGQNDASRDPHILLGKVLRITRDGGIPPTNPYLGADSDRCNDTGRTDVGKKCQETFASGLRNPFRFAFDPNASGTRFFVNDVGEAKYEEVDLGTKGADYAWNLCEGNHDNPNMAGSVNCSAAPYTPPIHEYGHDTGCSSITGAAFVPNGVWPAAYDNSYLYSDYVCGKIFRLEPDGTGSFTRTEFVTGLGEKSAVAMTFGPHGTSKALYYTTFGNGAGEVRRIAYTGDANRSPGAVIAANPTSGRLPLTVNFDGSGSGDPDAGDTLSYLWNFGDGSATKTTTTPTTSHTYSTKGTYTASLQVRDNHGALSDRATVQIDAGNEAPELAITSPSADLLFRVGQQITLNGSATDQEDGQLPASSFSWEVLKHHNGSHSHVVFEGAGNNLTFTAPPPEELSSTGTGNYLEVRFTATDSEGLSKTLTQELQPNRVNVLFETKVESNPSTLSVQINGQAFTTPRTLVSWEGYNLRVNAPSPQTLSGTTYVFSSWSDGKGQQHDIVTGATPSTYTATFKACTKTGTSGADVLDGTSSADVLCGLGGNDQIRGFGGNDTIEGMGSSDTLRGGGGADAVKGGAGADSLYGGDGNDALDSRDGVSGNDTLDGGTGTDTKVTDTTEKSIVGFP
jgi:glucose/arabinose dehydrogenase/Ca2+-binding RTX toxin-like protein